MIGQPTVVLALVALFLGLTVLATLALGTATKASRPGEQMRRRLAAYRVAPPAGTDIPAGQPSDRPTGRSPGRAPERPTADGDTTPGRRVARTTVRVAEHIVARRGLDTALAIRLEAAAVPMRPAEWLLLHIGAGIGGSLLMGLLTRGRPAPGIMGLLVGLAGPWMFLLVRQGRREAAFLAHLPDTLQLLASSLKAGYSLPQAIDTVVRQGEPPIAGEFRRAMFENRLGVPMEDALDRVADRLRSDDFSWVVMAIRIQRNVGGNLAELLTSVADTLRERERLRRQVQVLSAEGRLSGIILGALPIVFGVYLMLARPTYLRPMASPLGIAMLVAAAVLLAVGGVWVAKIVRVEV